MPHAHHNNNKELIVEYMFWINTILADVYHSIFTNFRQKFDEGIVIQCDFIHIIWYVRSVLYL